MRRLTALALIALAPIVAGCGSDGPIQAVSSLPGIYTLRSVNGAALPFMLVAGDPSLEVTGDELALASGGSFAQRTSFRITTGGVASADVANETGTYTESGATVTLRFARDNSTVTGVVSGNTVTISAPGLVLVYARP